MTTRHNDEAHIREAVAQFNPDRAMPPLATFVASILDTADPNAIIERPVVVGLLVLANGGKPTLMQFSFDVPTAMLFVEELLGALSAAKAYATTHRPPQH